MTNEQATHRQEVRLTFSSDISDAPVVCQLVSNYNLTFNILQAQISPRKEGTLTLELIGTQDNILQGIEHLKECGVTVLGVIHKIAKTDTTCMHCGMCTALCPVGALYVEPQTRHVLFNTDTCTACGLCTRICPVGAMHGEMSQITM